MGEQYDLLIRGGTLVDGTGAPARRGDVGVRDGKIAAVGEVRGTAARTLDADGCGRRARLRRHPHPLRRAGVLGSHADDLAVARRDDRRDRQLRLRRRADAAGAPRAHPAHARERRGHVDRRAPRRHRRRVAVRDLPAVPRRDRAARHGDQRRRAGRPHRRAPLRDGRGGDRARRHRRRDRRDARHRRRSACAPARSASRPRSRRPTSATPAGRCRAAPPTLEEIDALADAPRRSRRTASCRRRIGPGLFLEQFADIHRAHRQADQLDRAARRHAAARTGTATSSSDRRRCRRTASRSCRRWPAVRSTSSSSGRRRSPSRACALFKPVSAGRPRGQEAHLRRSRRSARPFRERIDDPAPSASPALVRRW